MGDLGHAIGHGLTGRRQLFHRTKDHFGLLAGLIGFVGDVFERVDRFVSFLLPFLYGFA